MSEIKNKENIEEIKVEESEEVKKESKFDKFINTTKKMSGKVGTTAWNFTKKTAKVVLEGGKALTKGMVNAVADSANAMIDESTKTKKKK